jgi:hypothetical protein
MHRTKLIETIILGKKQNLVSTSKRNSPNSFTPGPLELKRGYHDQFMPHKLDSSHDSTVTQSRALNSIYKQNNMYNFKMIY